MVISPEIGVSRSARTRRKVVLPHPDGPMKLTNSPWWIVRVTLLSASTGPSLVLKVREISRASMTTGALKACPPARGAPTRLDPAAPIVHFCERSSQSSWKWGCWKTSAFPIRIEGTGRRNRPPYRAESGFTSACLLQRTARIQPLYNPGCKTRYSDSGNSLHLACVCRFRGISVSRSSAADRAKSSSLLPWHNI